MSTARMRRGKIVPVIDREDLINLDGVGEVEGPRDSSGICGPSS